MECPICYDVIAEGASHRTTCGHVFHQACMTTWLERATTCPSCRTTVTEAPANPEAEPSWLGWFEERFRVIGEELVANRAQMASIAATLVELKDEMAAHEAARKAKRSAAAKRGAATRAANRAARVTCN